MLRLMCHPIRLELLELRLQQKGIEEAEIATSEMCPLDEALMVEDEA
jgi:hypothetical protein